MALLEQLTPRMEEDIDDFGVVFYSAGPLDKVLEGIDDEGLRLLCARDLAYATIHKRPASQLGFGGYIREGLVYYPEQPTLLARESPLLDLEKARKVVQVDRELRGMNHSVFERDIYERYRKIAEDDRKKEPEERRVLKLAKRGGDFVPLEKFGEHDQTRFLFLDMAKTYAEYMIKWCKNDTWDYHLPFMLVEQGVVDKLGGTILTQAQHSCFPYGPFFGDANHSRTRLAFSRRED